MRRRQSVVLVSVALTLTALTACRSNAPSAPATPPAPPTPVSAAFAPHVQLGDYRIPSSPALAPAGDTRLHVRCRTCVDYAQHPRDKNWVDHWFLITCDVLTVDRGTWPERTLTFVTIDPWPTPESGITLDKVWLYQPATEFLFDLDTTTHPATILGQAVLPPTATQPAAP